MELFRYSINLVLRHKLRTFLTSLGITISVILLTFIILGMQDLQKLFVDEFTSRFDPNQVIISRVDFTGFLGGAPEVETDEEQKEPAILTEDFVSNLKKDQKVEAVIEATLLSGFELVLPGVKQPFSQAIMSGMDIPASDNLFVGYEGSENKKAGELFLSSTVLDSYKLKTEDILGKEIIVRPSKNAFLGSKTKSQLDKEYKFKVVAIVDVGADRNDAIFNVEDSVKILAEIGNFDDSSDYLSNIGYDQLFVTVKEGEVENFKTEVQEKYNLTTYTAEDFLDFLDLITVGITVVLVVFGIVSAVVASIGIINTMVMSIYEQTKEIGLNKALGASNSQIMIVYLIQAGFIGFLGSLLGLIVIFLTMMLSDGIVVKELAKIGFQTEQFFHFNWSIAFSIIIASVIVGIVAGMYPAIKAARLDAVKALRYE